MTPPPPPPATMTAVTTSPPHMTYLHLLSVINSEVGRFPPGRTVRILDAGCGDGGLIAYLAGELPRTDGDRLVALHGFEVHGHPTNDRDAMVARLAARFPGVPWDARCVVIDEDAPWPYPDGAFDVVVSNQVLEHVQDHDAFFRQVARVLGPDGFAVHLFPTRSVVVEPTCTSRSPTGSAAAACGSATSGCCRGPGWAASGSAGGPPASHSTPTPAGRRRTSSATRTSGTPAT